MTAVNDDPIVSDIPDQTIGEGGTFATINLDDYVSDVDGVDADVIWTYTGDSALTVTIDGSRVATITTPGVDWFGAETITFTATAAYLSLFTQRECRDLGSISLNKVGLFV